MSIAMLAVVPVRDGVLPAGGDEVVAECSGRVLLVGSGVVDARPHAVTTEVRRLETGPFEPGRWARMLAPLLASEPLVVLPASPDGRDLAPRLASALGHTLLAGAIEVTPERVTLTRGAEVHLHAVHSPLVVTLQPGVRGVDAVSHPADADADTDTDTDTGAEMIAPPASFDTGRDARVVRELAPDLATIDLGEAPRIIGGGAGLDGAERFAQLQRIAAGLGAAVGATRVITDRGWIEHTKQIGTTGVIVDPSLYLSFGVSGAVQHTSGLGTPDHIISVNTDPHCPMMQLSDLAIVADANAVLDELERQLGDADG